MADTLELFQRLSVALALGLLIGLERGWQERAEREGGRSAGLRTHALGGLLGGIWGLLARGGDAAFLSTGGAIALGTAFVAFSAIVAFYRFRETNFEGTFGVTTVVAAMLAFSLGAYAAVGDLQVAAATGVAVTALLALKRALHEWMQRLTWTELRSALVLLAMTFVALPVLPNRELAELAGLNPHEIWLMTVLIAAISFAGYIAVKLVGHEKGVILTGVAAGFVSSTAVTLTLARRAKEQPELSGLFTAGALAAGATMLARVVVVVALLSPQLARSLVSPLLTAALVLAGWAALSVWHHAQNANASTGIELENPFELGTVLKFGAILALIMLATKLLSGRFGASGLLALAVISGMGDVDAMTLAMARQVGAGVTAPVAAEVILTVVAVNTVSKAALAWSAGGRAAGLPMLTASIMAIIAGAAALSLSGGFT
ncbi:MAG: MgtC/SapB family protein [Hyphomicrobiaceae bacterium]